jgi:dynein heavy chain
MYVSEQDGLKAQFDMKNADLAYIQKRLAAYLEEKRLVFARFFFLGSDELLKILANTKDPMRVQDSMNTIFEGIAKVKFDADMCVYGMVSEEGEEVDFLDKIDVNEGDRKGNVELWMLDIEAAMRACLKDIAKRARQEYPAMVRTEWMRKWPGQCVLAVSQIVWTNEVERSLAAGKLQDYIDTQEAQI